jgi:hypothetical protein
MTKHALVRDHSLTDSQKIDMIMRKLFGDIDEDTLQQTEGHFDRFEDLTKKVNYIMYGGAISSSVVLGHFLGIPTQTVWQLLSHVPQALAGLH